MKELLRNSGHPWEEQPRAFTHGTYVRRQRVLIDPLDPSFASVPEAYRPTEPVVRTVVSEWHSPTKAEVKAAILGGVR